jgi:hypothetical protein
MSVMRAPEAWADDRVFTVEDLEDMPDDEFRYELDDGVLIVSPAPSNLHQHRPAVPGHDRAGRPCGNGFRVTRQATGRA